MIARWMEECRGFAPGVWGEYALRRDPQFQKLRNDTGYYIENANACGRAVAERTAQSHPGLGMRPLAEVLGLKVEDMPPFALPGYYQFAEFEEPGTVRVSQPLVGLAEELAEQEQIGFLHRPLEDHLLAHEIFHFLEMRDNTLFTRTETVETLRIGPVRRTSGIRSLGEIAAMQFAQTILGLDYSPFLMDILLLYPKEPKAAGQLYEEVAAIAAAQ